MGAQRRLHLNQLGLTPDEAGELRAQVPSTDIECPQTGKVGAQAGRSDLKHPHRGRQVTQPSRSQIEKINTGEQHCRRLGQQMTAVPGGHHPCGAVDHRAEVVPVPQFGFPGGEMPIRTGNSSRPLRRDRSIDGNLGDANAATTPSPVWLNKKTVVPLDRGAQHHIMRGQRRPHPIGVGLPPTGRPLDIGEQKRHHPRRGHRLKTPRSGCHTKPQVKAASATKFREPKSHR